MTAGTVFDRLTTVALLAAVAYGFFVLPTRASTSADAAAIGKMAPPIPGTSYSQFERTLVLSVRSTCSFCTDSMPFYKTVVEARSTSKDRFGLVAVSTEDRSVLKTYLSEHGVSFPDVAQIGTSGWNDYLRTPTALVIDSTGKIIGRWTGRLPPSGEAEVRRMLGI